MKNFLKGFLAVAFLALTMTMQLTTPALAEGISGTQVWGMEREKNSALMHNLDGESAEQVEDAENGKLSANSAVGCQNLLTISEDSTVSSSSLNLNCRNSGDVDNTGINDDGGNDTIVLGDSHTFD